MELEPHRAHMSAVGLCSNMLTISPDACYLDVITRGVQRDMADSA